MIVVLLDVFLTSMKMLPEAFSVTLLKLDAFETLMTGVTVVVSSFVELLLWLLAEVGCFCGAQL
jgi:hypothetical protein